MAREDLSMSDFKAARARLREVSRSRQAGADCEANPLVDVNVSPFGEGRTFFVDWDARPRNPAHSVWLVEVIITPALPGVGRTDYIVQARQSDGPIPANLALNGASAHEDIPPGTTVRISLVGNIKVGNDPNRFFCFDTTIVSE
jgi:hypothetical protein